MRLDVKPAGDAKDSNVEVLALKGDDGISLIVYNHDLERRTVKPEQVRIVLKGDVSSVSKAVIDDTHTNPLKAWEEMGSPAYLKKEGVDIISKASELVYEDVDVKREDGAVILEFTAAEESVTVFKF